MFENTRNAKTDEFMARPTPKVITGRDSTILAYLSVLLRDDKICKIEQVEEIIGRLSISAKEIGRKIVKEHWKPVSKEHKN